VSPITTKPSSWQSLGLCDTLVDRNVKATIDSRPKFGHQLLNWCPWIHLQDITETAFKFWHWVWIQCHLIRQFCDLTEIVTNKTATVRLYFCLTKFKHATFFGYKYAASHKAPMNHQGNCTDTSSSQQLHKEAYLIYRQESSSTG